MIHAYDKAYLSCAQTCLAVMLDYAVNDLGWAIEEFWAKFLDSDLSRQFERGSCAVIAGRSGVELACDVLGETNVTVKPRFAAGRSEEYWTGWALAYWQWLTGLTFRAVTDLVPIAEIRAMYSPYHEMDILQFCDRMTELTLQRRGETNLKRLRQKAGLSQAELAEEAGLSVRTLQQYEQRRKLIDCARAETVFSLARALGCPPEALLERVSEPLEAS